MMVGNSAEDNNQAERSSVGRVIAIATVDRFQLQWNDKRSGGRHDGAFYRPIPPTGFKSVGDYGQSNYNAPAPSKRVIAVKGLLDDVLKHPIRFERIWKDSGSGAARDGSFWRPVPPAGYVALGLVCQNGYSEPATDCVVCLKKEYLVKGELGKMVWDDSKTGAHQDFGSWEIVSRSEDAVFCNTFTGVVSHQKPDTSYEVHALNRACVQFADQKLESARSTKFRTQAERITFRKNGYPLDYHQIAGNRFQHCQDMIRLPDDAQGNRYYMGTYSQNCSDTEGGMVFVGKVYSGSSGEVVWCDVLHNRHLAGGYNHPGDLRRLGNIVVIAGQNWNQDSLTEGINIGGGAGVGAAVGSVVPVFGTLVGAGIGALIGGTTEPADPMKRGNGGQNILFYDVSNPAHPVYIGRLDTFLHNGKWVSLDSDIDEISLHSYDGYYYLAFNGISSFVNGLKCRAKLLSPNACWICISEGSENSPSPMLLGNDTMWASFSDKNKVRFNPFTFGNKPPGVGRDSEIPATRFGKGVTFSITTLANGRSYIVRLNVESDSQIEIEEVEST